MDKLLTFIISVFVLFSMGKAQGKKIKNLPCELKKNGVFNVAAVRTVDTATFVDIRMALMPNAPVKFSKTHFFINAVDSDIKFRPKSIKGAQFEVDFRMPKSGDTLVTLIFDPLPHQVKKIDFGVNNETYIYGVSLDGKENKAIRRKAIEQEKVAQAWVKQELAKAKKIEPLTSFNGNDFFKKDSVRIVGYIKGYDPKLGFTSGMVYNANEFTREDLPATVRIYDNGTFEVSYQILYPRIMYMWIDEKPAPFYIEPGQTLGMIMDWEDFLMMDRYRGRSYTFQYTKYLGALGKINQEFAQIKINEPPYSQLPSQQKKINPTDFKERYVQTWQSEKKRLDSIIQAQHINDKVASLLRSTVDVSYANYLFDYTMSRDYYSQQDTTNTILKIPVEAVYYDFLNYIDLNKSVLLTTDGFSTLINRYEYAKPFIPTNHPNDTVLIQSKSVKQSLVNDIALLRRIAVKFNHSPAIAKKLYTDASAKINQPFILRNIGDYADYLQKKKDGYELPDTYGAQVFKKITDLHKGKILLVDFWAEWCGPCRGGIEQNLADRIKYADDPNFDFLFITDGSTSDAFHEKYIVEQKMKNAHKISNDDYLALRELFKFNGIPRYVLVGADGKILDDNFNMYSWKQELIKRDPEKFQNYFKQ